jgi:outer membrane protein assembly factor BamB
VDEKTARRTGERSRPAPRAKIWEVPGRRYNCLVAGPGAILAAGQRGRAQDLSAFLCAFDLATGAELWSEELPAPAVRGGAAVDCEGWIAVALQDGQVLAWAPSE